VSLLGEVVSQVVGELLGGLFGSNKARQPFPEGETNASFGAASAFFGSLGLLSSLLAAPFAVLEGPTREMSLGAIASVATIGLLCSYIGYHFGRRAPQVTRRRLGMAKYGVVVSVPGILLSAVALVICGARTLL
jgi:hypothetical protein